MKQISDMVLEDQQGQNIAATNQSCHGEPASSLIRGGQRSAHGSDPAHRSPHPAIGRPPGQILGSPAPKSPSKRWGPYPQAPRTSSTKDHRRKTRTRSGCRRVTTHDTARGGAGGGNIGEDEEGGGAAWPPPRAGQRPPATAARGGDLRWAALGGRPPLLYLTVELFPRE